MIKHDGCKDCEYEELDASDMPCEKCKYTANYNTVAYEKRMDFYVSRGEKVMRSSDCTEINSHSCAVRKSQRIDEIPTIEPKRGEWTENSAGNIICNQCGHYALSREKANYCHFCGTDMRGDKNE